MDLPRFRCQLRVTSEYRRFQVGDPEAPDAPEEWTEQEVADRVSLSAGCIVVSPARDGTIPVEVSFWSEEPPVMFNHWQHALEVPLATNGRIAIQDWDGQEEATLAVDPGDYTVRLLFGGLGTISEDGFTGQDFYRIQIWKAPCARLRVLRRWP